MACILCVFFSLLLVVLFFYSLPFHTFDILDSRVSELVRRYHEEGVVAMNKQVLELCIVTIPFRASDNREIDCAPWNYSDWEDT